ncbi:protein kinase C substrate 80K-H [Kwoniella heveanensis CBS 569]|nr:protein kinase C substrate 80K-H [Kwoniella heveanensis CBS 569]
MTFNTLLPLLSLLAIATPTALAQEPNKPLTPESIRGLNPALYDKYEPNPSNVFTCLDGSKVILYSSINDDYCDCPDGSDEPGTSACPNGVFWCKNEGHIPGQILSSRVNDGLCDPECCDGSDEWATGACPNRCDEIGRAHREATEAERKTRKTGAKIRGTYIKWAQGEKKRLEDELEKKHSEVKAKEAEVERARIALEKVEEFSKKDLEKKKQSPLYLSLLSHRLALTRLRSRTSRLQSELDALHSILSDLAKGYNPNYQDMAVKAAVVGYEELTGTAAARSSGEGEEVKPDVQKDTQEDEEEEIKDWELDELDRKDLEALLLSDITEVSGNDNGNEDDLDGGLLWKIDEYIPDSMYDSWETVRDTMIDWMIRFGLIGGKSKAGSKAKTSGGAADGPHVAAAKEKHRNLANDLNKLRNEITKSEETIGKLGGGSGFGPSGEWKKLDGTCVDKVSGDYTYELCFFGRATQKSNKDGSSNYMGTFSHWNTDAEEGSLSYYSKQMYKNGAKCWNGPMRSVGVDITCGTKNELLSISEPEKCEYRFKVTSPALCWPDEELQAGVGAGAGEDVKAEVGGDKEAKAEAEVKDEL